MWQLLRAEINYNKAMFSIAYSLAFILLIAVRLWNIDGIYGFTIITANIVLISIIILGVENKSERRERFYIGLPISLKQISLVRLLFVVIFQAGMFLLWGVFFFLEYLGIDNQVVWSMLGMNAFLFIILNFFILFYDLNYFHTVKYRITYIAVIFLLITGIIALVMKGYLKPEYFSIGVNVGNKFSKSFSAAVIYNIMCMGMFYLSHKIFIYRKSYLA